jgi:tRNA(Ile)-lysidine synthase
MIVNHNLRSEASEEVQYVKLIAEKLGCNVFELSWHCGDNKIALQERAKQGRYELICNKCHELGINTLLTAHHLDDMLETYLMRENKKSGVFGLSSAHSFFYNNDLMSKLSNQTLRAERNLEFEFCQ